VCGFKKEKPHITKKNAQICCKRNENSGSIHTLLKILLKYGQNGQNTKLLPDCQLKGEPILSAVILQMKLLQQYVIL
jgi:hypothetical protein